MKTNNFSNNNITPWQTISSKTAYNHPFFKVREDKVKLPNGTAIPDYAIWANDDVAQTILIHKGKALMVEMYKHGAGEVILEFPGGFVESGEDPSTSAKRELQEETGVVVQNLIPLTTCIHHPTKETSRTHLFLANIADEVKIVQKNQDLDSTENIKTHWIDWDEIKEMILDGKIVQTGSIAGYFLADEKLKLEVKNA